MYSLVGVSGTASIATTPGVSVATGASVGTSVGARVGASVEIDAAGTSVGTFVGVSAAWAANAIASIGFIAGLAISAGAQRFSCVGAGARTLLTIEARAGLVIANNAIKPTSTRPAPANNAGKSQFLPFDFNCGTATTV